MEKEWRLIKEPLQDRVKSRGIRSFSSLSSHFQSLSLVWIIDGSLFHLEYPNWRHFIHIPLETLSISPTLSSILRTDDEEEGDRGEEGMKGGRSYSQNASNGNKEGNTIEALTLLQWENSGRKGMGSKIGQVSKKGRNLMNLWFDDYIYSWKKYTSKDSEGF